MNNINVHLFQPSQSEQFKCTSLILLSEHYACNFSSFQFSESQRIGVYSL